MVTADPLILGFDTSGPYCDVALLRGETVLCEKHEPMKRGQAERLMPLVEEVLAEASASWADLDIIGVGVGPGNFTGIRISVSAARGLALALGIPAVGVSMFEVLASVDPELKGRMVRQEPSALVVVQAPRDQVYVQKLKNGQPQETPRLIDPKAPPSELQMPAGMSIVGHSVQEVAQHFQADAYDIDADHIAARIAELAHRQVSSGQTIGRPAPLYVKSADAAPPRDPAPVILT